MSSRTIGLTGWVRSVPAAARLLVSGRIRLRHEHVGVPLTMSDGRTYTPFRETVRDPATWAQSGRPAVLQPRFRLRGMDARHRWRHALFRRVCIVTTPFFVGIRGFRSKLWMVDPTTGDFAGLYEWDDADGARAYAEGLGRVLRALSVPGSVDYELVADTTVDEYLGRHEPSAARQRAS